VYGAIVFIWIFLPVYSTIIASLSTDIIEGICIPYGASYSNCSITSIIVITYLMPLLTMLFCYSRIVYKLRSKVTSTL